MIIFRQATPDDIPNIMRFIDEHWRKGDTLARNRAFFEWNYIRKGVVTMVVAVDENTNSICGIQGYLPYTDEDLYPDCAGSIWKAIKCDDPLIGIHMAEYMHQNIHMRYYAGAGMRKRAIRVAKLNGGSVATMDHYYRLNSEINEDDYRIATVKEKIIPDFQSFDIKMEKIQNMNQFMESLDQSILIKSVFCKDYRYIKWRYFDHPVYRYDLWKLCGADCDSQAVIVTRNEIYNGSSMCKIIDYFGDYKLISKMGTALDKLMKDNNHEYIDVYSYGVNTEYYSACGMARCDSDSPNIIPNYFQPFVSENIDIYLEEPKFDGLVLFRGDGDQDRPIIY